MASKDAKWYVAHTYSGYENKVMADITKTVENRNMSDIIQDIKVPMEEVIEIKDNKKRIVERKIFPGYVMVKMIMTDESWYVVRNCRGVTGFVGPGSKPVPLSAKEVENMGLEHKAVQLDFSVGDNIRVKYRLKGLSVSLPKFKRIRKKFMQRFRCLAEIPMLSLNLIRLRHWYNKCRKPIDLDLTSNLLPTRLSPFILSRQLPRWWEEYPICGIPILPRL